MKVLALFDLDGTLLDTPRAIATAMAQAVQDATGKAADEHVLQGLVGRPLPKIVNQLARAVGDAQSAAAIQAAYLRRFESQILPLSPQLVFHGVKTSLQALRRSQATIGVITNKNRVSAQRMLDAAGLLPFLDLVIGADDVMSPKPSPEGIRSAVSESNPDYTFYVGDTPDDMTAACAAGVNAIGVTYGVGTSSELLQAGAHVAVASFADACIVGTAGRATVHLSTR